VILADDADHDHDEDARRSERLTSPLTVCGDLHKRSSAQRSAATYSHGGSQGFKSPHLHPAPLTSGNTGHPGLSSPSCCCRADGERLRSPFEPQARCSSDDYGPAKSERRSLIRYGKRDERGRGQLTRRCRLTAASASERLTFSSSAPGAPARRQADPLHAAVRVKHKVIIRAGR
jgi:hypothetical protein